MSRAPSSPSLSLLLFAGVLGLGACGDKDDSPMGGSGAGGETGGGEAGGGEDGGDDGGDDTGNPNEGWTFATCEGGEGGEAELVEAAELVASVTWTLDFDEDAEADGNVDCSYTRELTAERVSGWGWLCAECTDIFRGEAVMTEGFEDCYPQISSSPEQARVELWGLDGETLYRSGRDQFPLGALTTYVAGEGPVAVSWESENTFTDGTGGFLLSAAGQLEVTATDGELEEAFPPREAAYACGWECQDPGTLELDYSVEAVGDVMPNFRLRDQCGDYVELWDFYGAYLVLDTSQSDCGPCRSMAEAEEAFLTELRAEGIDVRVITLMGNGLSEPYGTPPESTVSEWIESYGLTDPVLYDEGYAYAIFPDFIEAYNGDSFGYPAWMVVDPQMQVLHGNVGFSSWEAVAEVIRADHEAR